ncbi:hypothetical protein [Streptomyces sp. NPDC047315]|uniref:hypothetical protein n=1 Tax=Streptomyces sp. NPDC047315 TaxID=3155142 RepID=UPI0033D919A7
MRFTATTRTVATLGATTALLAGIATATTAHAGSAHVGSAHVGSAHVGSAQPTKPQTWEPQRWEPQKAADVASVRGSAQIHFSYSANDTIRFSVDAKATPFAKPIPGAPKGLPTDAGGTLKFSHYDPDSGRTGWAIADVDCLVTGGRTATFSAVVRKSNTGEDGKRVGISVQQGESGRPDRLGFSWGVVNVDGRADGGVGTCLAPAAFAPVVKGGYKVVHTDLPPLPAGALPPPKH